MIQEHCKEGLINYSIMPMPMSVVQLVKPLSSNLSFFSVVISSIPGSGRQGCQIFRNAQILVGTVLITRKGSARGDVKI